VKQTRSKRTSEAENRKIDIKFIPVKTIVMAFCENFFETIDTPEKAYILGVVALNNTSDDPNDDLSVYIEINNVREIRDTCETSRRILYDYYLDLGEEEKKKYPYFNNIDTLVECLRKIGTVSIEAEPRKKSRMTLRRIWISRDASIAI
jgi:hypothetical protein